MRVLVGLFLVGALGPLCAGELPSPTGEFAFAARAGEEVAEGVAWVRREATGLVLEQTWPARVEIALAVDARGELRGAAPLQAGFTAQLLGAEREALRFEVRLRANGPGYVGAWRTTRDGRTLASGTASWRQSRAEALSPLAAAIRAAVEPVAGRGTVPARSVFSRGRPEPDALVRGPAVFGRMAELIAGAEREVLFLTYTWEAECGPSLRIAAALRELAARRKASGGPPVRAWFVVNGGLFAKRTAIQSMRRDLAGLDLAPWVDVRLVRHEHLAFGALHTKSLVVDGRVALVSGANPEAKHDGERPWHDLGFVVHGQAAYAAREDFAQVWRKTTGEELPEVPLPAAHPADVPVFAISRRGQGNPLRRSIRDPQGQAYLAAIEHAQRSIRILTPNLNYRPLMEALARAAARGVHVQLVLSRGFNSDAENRPLQGGCNDTTVGWLQERAQALGIGPGLLDPRWYSQDGAAPLEGNGPGASHAKYLSVDDAVVLVGSTNLDTQSLVHSRELDFLVDDVATTRAWDARVFLPAWERAIPAGGRPARTLPPPLAPLPPPVTR
ncbi:MAG: phosphatidylserine/phosphatidylglycerophosphate/cardiolipin synthase family protein [Planctomycetes bacterium]|nr:phosphatidylserine/phosphatidylglycerophosphate/cardiolipin synthase family protein [Planctomycetota bacterium]